MVPDRLMVCIERPMIREPPCKLVQGVPFRICLKDFFHKFRLFRDYENLSSCHPIPQRHMALFHTLLASCSFSSSSRPFFSRNTSRRPGSNVICSTSSRNRSSSYVSKMAGRWWNTPIRYSVWDISHSKAFCPFSCRSRLWCASSCASTGSVSQ